MPRCHAQLDLRSIFEEEQETVSASRFSTNQIMAMSIAGVSLVAMIAIAFTFKSKESEEEKPSD